MIAKQGRPIAGTHRPLYPPALRVQEHYWANRPLYFAGYPSRRLAARRGTSQQRHFGDEEKQSRGVVLGSSSCDQKTNSQCHDSSCRGTQLREAGQAGCPDLAPTRRNHDREVRITTLGDSLLTCSGAFLAGAL